MVRILALREKFAHMASVSGYDALYSHFPAEIKIDSIFSNFKKIYPRGIGRILAKASDVISKSGFYNAQSVEMETRLLAKSFRKKYDIIHYTYGEPYFGLLSIARKPRAPIILTHHQPVSWWLKHESLLKKYRNVGGVIALSDYDNAYFNSILPGKSVCIPHGVDTNFYKPSTTTEKNPTRPFRVIFAGRYLRDMVTLAAVIKQLTASSLNIEFDIVSIEKAKVSENYLLEIMSLPNVTWHSDIPEQQLLSLYQTADCALIPLNDCTANNAILEALACGLPIVSTELPAIKTYLDDSFAFLGRPGCAEDLYHAVEKLYLDISLKRQMSEKARQKATEEFSWDKIASQTLGFFKSFE